MAMTMAKTVTNTVMNLKVEVEPFVLLMCMSQIVT